MKQTSRFAVAAALFTCFASGVASTACVSDDSSAPVGDAGSLDVTAPGFDAALHDAGPTSDATTPDAAQPDAQAAVDTGLPDTSALDAGAPDAPATVDASPDAAAPGTTFYVDPTNGSNTNDGGSGAPFQSIAYAATVINAADAGAGPFTLVLADGTYSASNQSSLNVSFTPPTIVRASAPGKVTLVGAAGGGGQEILYFQHGGAAQNLTFQTWWYGVEALHGSFAVSGCSFNSSGGGGYLVAAINDAVATLDTTGSTIDTFKGTLGAIYVDNSASLTWTAGNVAVTNGSAGVNLLFSRGGASIGIDGLSLSNYPGYVAVGYDQTSITFKSSTITGSGWASGVGGATTAGAIYIGGSQSGVPAPSLSLQSTSITSSQGNAVAVVLNPNNGKVTRNQSRELSHLDQSTLAGIWANGSTASANLVVSVTGTSSTIDGNGLAGIYSPRATVSFGGTSSISNNAANAVKDSQTPGGIVLTDATSTNGILLRDTTLAANAGNAIALAGSASSSLDLGTSATPGGVTFSGVPSGSSAIALTALISASATGDTWMPNVQGADGTGKFASQTTISGPASGLNVTEPSGASVTVGP